MSLYGLRSEISSLQSQISRVNSEISQFQYELNRISSECYSSISELNRMSSKINNTFHENANALEHSDQRMKDIIVIQGQIRELLFIFEDVQLANKKIRMLNNKLYFEFNNQNKVRKIVRGFLDNLDLDLVNQDKIYKAIEKEHLQAPDFWLTYALLAIMAWKENNKDKCYKALEGALKLDRKSTTIFMMLFFVRLRRYDTAMNWFEEYKSLEKLGKDDDAILMLISSIPTKINEENEMDELSNNILNYINQLVEESGNQNEQEYLATIQSYLEKLNQHESLNLPFIRNYVREYPIMVNTMSLAKNNQNILDYFLDISQVLKKETNRLIDAYIEKLIDIPSLQEEEIHKEINYNDEIINTLTYIKQQNQMITSSEFRELAKQRFDEIVDHDESTLNLCDELINWGFTNKDNKINSLTTWNIFTLNSPYVRKAYDNYLYSYQRTFNQEKHMVFPDFEIATKFKNLDNDLLLKDQYLDDKETTMLSKIKNTVGILCFVGAGILVALGIYLMIAVPFLMALGVLSLIISVIFIISGVVYLVSNVFNRKKIKKYIENEKIKYDDIIRSIYKEVEGYNVEFIEADKVSNDVYDFFKKYFG